MTDYAEFILRRVPAPRGRKKFSNVHLWLFGRAACNGVGPSTSKAWQVTCDRCFNLTLDLLKNRK